ncbi:MAG TPA: hypothetical protein VL981_05325 [Candidatus Methylacidiphilales bacterium]|nr:hypothetical protein [Candidatus Methylacidiphilales bacterium]
MKILESHALTKESVHYRLKNEWWERILRSRKRAKSKSKLLRANNVVGICVAQKHVGGRPVPVVTVKFLVQKKYPKSRIDSKERIPATSGDVVTDVEEVGLIRPLSCEDTTGRKAYSPLQPGCSIGYAPTGASPTNAGTLGAIVVDAGGVEYLLSSAHVFMDLANPSLPTTIVQPGTIDSATSSQVGTHTQNSPLAKVSDGISVLNSIIQIGAITGAAEPKTHKTVQKFGRTTGYTTGLLVSTTANFTITYGDNVYNFQDQIMVQPIGACPFGDEGDSGALVLETITNNAVGVLLAVSGGYAYANPLPEILSQYGVRLK